MNPTECGICTHLYTTDDNKERREHDDYDDSDHIPKILPCGHTFCSMCVASMCRDHVIVCPQCRVHHDIIDCHLVPKNYTLIDLIQMIKSNPSIEVKIEKRRSHCEDGEIQPPLELFTSIQRKSLDLLSVEEVSNLLVASKLSKYIEKFRENEIDGLCLSHCRCEDDLIEIGIHVKVKARQFFERIQIYQLVGVPLSDIQSNTIPLSSPSPCDDDSGLLVSGMTGIHEFMNGLYYPTEEYHMDKRRYFKFQHDCWMEYHALYQQWQIKPTTKKSTTNAWAYLPSPSSMSHPYDSSSVWSLFDGEVFRVSNTVRCVPSRSLFLAGGPERGMNGYYEPITSNSSDISSQVCRYRLRSRGFFSSPQLPEIVNQTFWMEYSKELNRWQVIQEIRREEREERGDDQVILFFPSHYPKEIWERPLRWSLASSSFAPSLTNDVITFPRIYSFQLVGGNSTITNHIIGVYFPTEEVFGGWVRYKKRGDDNCWIEYMPSQHQWHVKPVKDKGLTNAWACVKHYRGETDDLDSGPSGPPYEAEESWLVFDGQTFQRDLTLKCVRRELLS